MRLNLSYIKVMFLPLGTTSVNISVTVSSIGGFFSNVAIMWRTFCLPQLGQGLCCLAWALSRRSWVDLTFPCLMRFSSSSTFWCTFMFRSGTVQSLLWNLFGGTQYILRSSEINPLLYQRFLMGIKLDSNIWYCLHESNTTDGS